MTNEQAIKELQESHDIMRNHDIDESESYLMQALNMAIKALQTQADGEKTCGTCRNEDTYHCAECENKSDYEQAQAEVNAHVIQSALDNGTNTVIGTAQADGEYISRKALLEDLYKRDYTKFTHRDFVALVQYQDIVAIPPEHDGCKDCRWQSQSETEMPCKQCMHNYTDEWERAKIGHWIWQTEDIYQCSECHEDIHVKEVMNKPQYAWCPICGCPMEIER